MDSASQIKLSIQSSRFGRSEQLAPGLPCVIGRSPACGLFIDDPSISNRHALLSFSPRGELTIRDLDSTNGIMLNGRRIDQATLSLPAELVMGNVSVIVSQHGNLDQASARSASARAVPEIPSFPGRHGEAHYYRRDGKEIGPLQWSQMRELAGQGKIRKTDLIWNADSEKWKVAGDLPDLFAGGDKKAGQTRAHGRPADRRPTSSGTAASPAQAAAPARRRHSSRGNIVCPHCWHKFDVEDFLYIARHHDLIGDSVLGPEAQQRFLPSKFTPEGHAVDSAGLSCPDMACPRCHLRIPRAAAEMPPLFVSIVGAPASGKSYFLTAMMWELRNTLAKNFAMAFTDTDAISNQILNDFEEDLFLNSDPEELVALRKTELQGDLYNSVVLDGMPVNLLKPFMFSVTPAEHHPDYEKVRERISRTLVLYDNAGEHFEPGMDSVDNPTTRHLIFSDTVFFLFDPTKDARFRKRCLGKADPQLSKGARVQRQEVLLTEMNNRIEKYSGQRGRGKLKKTLVIIVPKSDIWLDMLGCEIPPEPWAWDPKYRTCALDIDCIMSTSFAVRNLLEDICPELVASADACSNDLLFLPNSALGCSPELDPESEILGVRPGQIKPFWIQVPMLYLFYRHGLTPVLSPERLAPRDLIEVDHTTSGDVVFVDIPGQPIPLQVPKSYIGYRLRCPQTGQWFKIQTETPG